MGKQEIAMVAPSLIWTMNLEALTSEFGAKASQTLDKYFSVQPKYGQSVQDAAQFELDTLAQRLAPLGRLHGTCYQVTFKELVIYGRSADVWLELKVLSDQDTPVPPTVRVA